MEGRKYLSVSIARGKCHQLSDSPEDITTGLFLHSGRDRQYTSRGDIAIDTLIYNITQKQSSNLKLVTRVNRVNKVNRANKVNKVNMVNRVNKVNKVNRVVDCLSSGKGPYQRVLGVNRIEPSHSNPFF